MKKFIYEIEPDTDGKVINFSHDNGDTWKQITFPSASIALSMSEGAKKGWNEKYGDEEGIANP